MKRDLVLRPLHGENEIELFTMEELLLAKKRLQKRKAPGPDMIPNEVISEVIDICPHLLLDTYNICLRKGVFPYRWKKQKLTLLRKGVKPLNEPSSFRPICLLDTMGKLLERLILQKLEKHIELEGGLSPRQFGFRKRRSTIDAIQKVVDEANHIKNVPLGSNGFCALVTLDIRNAFNTARWEKIMDALERRNTPTYLLRIVDEYLANRTLIYKTEEGPKEYSVTAGIPQGSILGPFLWNVMYDGLLNVELPQGSGVVAFADDVAVVTTARSTSTLELVTNESLRRVGGWMRSNGLELAYHKTEAVLITDRRLFTSPALRVADSPVTFNKSVKYLGVHLDAKLRYEEHVKATIEKASTTAVALARLMPNIGGPKEFKRRLLNSVVHSKILYGAEVWAEAANRKSVRRRLASVQRRSVLRVISAYKTVSEQAALVLASTPPIDLLIQERQEIYAECRNTNDTTKRASAKRTARKRLLDRWQQRWAINTSGSWTHRLIPDLIPWCNRKHGQVDFYVTQTLTGHGCFNQYLARFKKRENAACLHCRWTPDDAHHAIFVRDATARERHSLERILGEVINEDNLVINMVKSETAWSAIQDYLVVTMKYKRDLERRQAENPM